MIEDLLAMSKLKGNRNAFWHVSFISFMYYHPFIQKYYYTVSAKSYRNIDVLAESSSIVIEISDTFPAASLADANRRTLIVIVID